MKNNVMLGLIVITIGTLLLGYQLEFWDVNLFFKGWWTLFIIIPGILTFFKKDYVGGFLTTIIGLLIYFAVNDVIGWELIGSIFIIACGISLLFTKIPKVTPFTVAKGDYLAIFASNEAKISGKFKQTSIVSIFGSVELDLRKAEIEKGSKINVFCLFGGVDVIAPNDVKVEVSGTPIFGGIENKVTTTANTVIDSECICIFGGISFK